MTDRLVVDLAADGAVRVGTVLEGELPSFGEAATLGWPLEAGALEDLRWYLEDYLIAAYGVYEDRGARIAGKLNGWGHAGNELPAAVRTYVQQQLKEGQ